MLADEGRSTRSIAKAVAVMPRTVSLWRGRCGREGLAGLAERPRPGPPAKYDAHTGRRVLAAFGSAAAGGVRPLDGAADRRRVGGCACPARLAGAARAKARPGGQQVLVREPRSGFRGQGRRRGRAPHGAARKCGGDLC
ncbi:MAG: helix-turn-helix domain-containing protein [Gemmatimonadaceae bacterium]|nr:helix-turn-helix domain-containing protein [Caulobacter sp.]